MNYPFMRYKPFGVTKQKGYLWTVFQYLGDSLVNKRNVKSIVSSVTAKNHMIERYVEFLAQVCLRCW